MSYLTATERKEPISHICGLHVFRSCVDLSEGVRVEKLPHVHKTTHATLIADTAQFTMWWTINFFKKLNGFSGIDTIKFIVDEPTADKVVFDDKQVDNMAKSAWEGDAFVNSGTPVHSAYKRGWMKGFTARPVIEMEFIQGVTNVLNCKKG